MPKRRQHRDVPYLRQSRSRRRDRFVSLRWQIKQDPNGAGVFTSHHMMNGGVYEGQPYQSGHDSQWNDFRFISKRLAREGLVYSATVRTALMAALDAAEDYAWESERATLTPEEAAAAHPPMEFVPCGRGMFTLKEHTDPVFERLGGVTAWGLRARFLREAIAHLPPIYPSCRLDHTYSTGVGAIFITQDSAVTIPSLAALVEDFWARGEVAYQEAPVDFANGAQAVRLREMIEQVAAGWERMDRLRRGLEETSPQDATIHTQETM